jgi:hypothetical protein
MEIRGKGGRATIVLVEVRSWRNIFFAMCIARTTAVDLAVIVRVEICASSSTSIWGKRTGGGVGMKIVVLRTVGLGERLGLGALTVRG